MIKFTVSMLFLSIFSVFVQIVFSILDASEVIEWSLLAVCSPTIVAAGSMAICLITCFIDFMRDNL